MPDGIMHRFPVIQEGIPDFNADVSYKVEAERISKTLNITHKLTGNSFVRQLIMEKKAKFLTTLHYQDEPELQYHYCEDDISTATTADGTKQIIAKQDVEIKFSHPPKITPGIMIMEEVIVKADADFGVSNQWLGANITIPKNSYIAFYPFLKFTGGIISSLMWIEPTASYLDSGEMKVEIDQYDLEGKAPITLTCARDVYDELQLLTLAPITTNREALRSSIITQVLCALYSHMNTLSKDHEVRTELQTHLELLREETGMDWEVDDEPFNPSLAATKMWPYAILNDA